MPTPDAFPDTTLTLIGRLRLEDPSQRQEAMRQVAQRYWLPIYHYARRTGLSEPESADAVQDFFVHLLTHQDGFARFDPKRGSLRSWIITIFRHRLSSERQKQRAQFRGGGIPHEPLDFAHAESSYRQHATEDDGDPERAFDRAFARQLWDQVRETLRDAYTRRQRLPVYQSLAPFILADLRQQPLSSGELARRAGFKGPDDFKVALHRLRKEAAHEFKRLVRETVDGEDWQEEVRYLMRLIG